MVHGENGASFQNVRWNVDEEYRPGNEVVIHQNLQMMEETVMEML